MGTSEPAWETEMLAVFDHHKRCYGTRRLQVELREEGQRVGRQALRTGLRRHGQRALQPKAFAPRTTDSTHGWRCAPNLLRDAQVRLSHSWRGECYNNAKAESRWSRLKTEELEARDWPVFADLADADASVADYFDYYHHDRHHSSVDYLKPYQFHQQYLNNIT